MLSAVTVWSSMNKSFLSLSSLIGEEIQGHFNRHNDSPLLGLRAQGSAAQGRMMFSVKLISSSNYPMLRAIRLDGFLMRRKRGTVCVGGTQRHTLCTPG